MDDKEALVVWTADHHTNSMLALTPAHRMPRRKADSHIESKAQRAIRLAWVKLWDIVKQEKERLQCPLYTGWVGDLGDVNTYDGIDLISRNKADAVDYGIMLVDPVAAISDGMFFIKGTLAHAGEDWEIERGIAENFTNAIPDHNTGDILWNYFKGEFAGVRKHAQHKGDTQGRLEHTKGPAAARQADYVRRQYLERGEKPPHLAFYAHFHGMGGHSGKSFNTEARFCYPWQLTTSYGVQIGAASSVLPMGLHLVHCRNGSYTFLREDDLTVRPKGAKPWVQP